MHMHMRMRMCMWSPRAVGDLDTDEYSATVCQACLAASACPVLLEVGSSQEALLLDSRVL